MKKVIFIAVALFICSVANGLCYQFAPAGLNIILMVLIGLVCIILHYEHWKITKEWEKPLDPWNSQVAWFQALTGISLLAVVIAVFINLMFKDTTVFMLDASGFLTASITWLITSAIGARIESRYTCNL